MGNPRRTSLARGLRRHETDAERLLWSRQRGRRLNRGKFRRQHPVGPYIVDFACPEARLVVELDGGQHAARTAQDRERSGELAARGYRVLRFWNHDVLRGTDAVLQTILAAVSSPSPPPSPEQGRGNKETA